MEYEQTFTGRYMYRRLQHPVKKDYSWMVVLPIVLAMLLLPGILGLA